MSVFIPELGSELELLEDWSFRLYKERRNFNICKADGYENISYQDSNLFYMRTLPSGTKFIVDRIYVHKGQQKYSSVSLLIKDTTDAKIIKTKAKRKGKFFGRFWVKLADFNSANFAVIYDASISNKKQKELIPATLSVIKRRNYGQYWVKYTHPNTELSFEGEICPNKLSTVVIVPKTFKPPRIDKN